MAEHTNRKRQGMKVNGYSVLGRYLDVSSREPRNRPYDIELRNATLQNLDARDNCAVLDIRVHDWVKEDVDGDPEITDMIEVYSPDIRFHSMLGIIVTGHVRLCVRDGKDRDRNSQHYDTDRDGRVTRRLMTFHIQPESALDDDGAWLKSRKP